MREGKRQHYKGKTEEDSGRKRSAKGKKELDKREITKITKLMRKFAKQTNNLVRCT